MSKLADLFTRYNGSIEDSPDEDEWLTRLGIFVIGYTEGMESAAVECERRAQEAKESASVACGSEWYRRYEAAIAWKKAANAIRALEAE